MNKPCRILKQCRLIIILLGGPGAGKGTQAQALMKCLGIPHISTGDLLRAEIRAQSPIGKDVEQRMGAGLLVPDDIVNDLLFQRVRQRDCEEGFILDGYPRTLAQAVAVQALLRPLDRLIAIEIETDLPSLVERMSSRVSCVGCGAVYNRISAPPRIAGACDRCGMELVQRPDDREEVIAERFDAYRKQTSPLTDYFIQMSVYRRAYGMKAVDDVTLDILSILETEGAISRAEPDTPG